MRSRVRSTNSHGWTNRTTGFARAARYAPRNARGSRSTDDVTDAGIRVTVVASGARRHSRRRSRYAALYFACDESSENPAVSSSVTYSRGNFKYGARNDVTGANRRRIATEVL